MRARFTVSGAVSALALMAATAAFAQAGEPAAAADPGRTPPPAAGGPPGAPASARAAAPKDLTGQWVSVVTEDWQWRMVTPAKGDFASVPMTQAARDAAYKWDIAADNAAGNQCRAYGVGGIMRMPTRIRISWADDNTLKIETDAGQQTRMLRFVSPRVGPVLPALTDADPAPAQRDWQGQSKAQWYAEVQTRGLGFGGGVAPGAGALRVISRNMKAGYLRKNGVPYSENAVITEQYNRHDEPNGDAWITITTIVVDPANLQQPFITSSEFKKEKDTSKWNPQPCQTAAPLAPDVPPPRPRGQAAAAPAAPAPAAR